MATNAPRPEMSEEKSGVEKPLAEKMTSDTRVIIKGPNGELKTDREKFVVVHCSDGKYVEIPKEQAALCSGMWYMGAEEGIPEFSYPAPVLENLVRWTWKYGVEGSATSALVLPCIYRDFSYVVTDAWDDDFYRHRLFTQMNQKYFLTTMNAAEEFGMKGLLNFMAVCIGCKLRNEDDSTIIHDIMGLDADVEITDEDLSKVPSDYKWFNDATKPTTMK